MPHAVRELDALGLLDELVADAVEPTTLAYFTKRGEQIWDEPRGVPPGIGGRSCPSIVARCSACCSTRSTERLGS